MILDIKRGFFMKDSPYLTTIQAFDVNKLFPGVPFQLLEPLSGYNDKRKKRHCIVKKVTPFEITLFVAKLSNKEPREFEYEMEEITYSVNAFTGDNCYQLIPLLTEYEWRNKQEEL